MKKAILFVVFTCSLLLTSSICNASANNFSFTIESKEALSMSDDFRIFIDGKFIGNLQCDNLNKNVKVDKQIKKMIKHVYTLKSKINLNNPDSLVSIKYYKNNELISDFVFLEKIEQGNLSLKYIFDGKNIKE